MQNPNKTIFWAIIFVAVGVAFLLYNFGLFTFPVLPKYVFWTGLAAVLAINAFLDGKSLQGLIWLSVGAVILIPSLMGVPDWFSFRKLWPLIPIVIGLNLLVKYFFPGQYDGFVPNNDYTPKQTVALDAFERNVFMAGITSKLNSKDFKYGKISCMMAGIELDMSEAALGPNARIDINVIMGGIELTVPKEWNIRYETTPIMGGVEDTVVKLPNEIVDQHKNLTISGFIFMGGVSVKRI